MNDKVLIHHGIKGQRWGQRNGPPYPLDFYSHSKAELAGFRSKKKKHDSYSVGLTHFQNPQEAGKEWLSGLIEGHDFDWMEVSKIPNDTRYTGVANLIENYGGDEIFRTNNSPEHSQFRLSDLDLSRTNPTFGEPGTTQNCAKCSAAMEMRLRGYDISAGRQTYPSTSDACDLWFNGAKTEAYDYRDAENAIRSWGKKTSGSLSIQYPGGSGGHMMHWTVDSDGRFEIQDGQNGRRFSSLDSMTDTYGADRGRGIAVTRLDNCEPNYHYMNEDGVLRGLDPDKNKVYNKFSNRMVSTW